MLDMANGAPTTSRMNPTTSRTVSRVRLRAQPVATRAMRTMPTQYIHTMIAASHHASRNSETKRVRLERNGSV